jgi:hypothetical protein
MGRKKARTKPTNQRYNAAKGKERRALNHTILVDKQAQQKKKRLELTAEACEKLGMNTYQLKRYIGTPNIRRLTAVLNGSHIDAPWFVARVEKKKADDEKPKTVVKKNSKKMSLRRKRKKTKEVSEGSNRGD